MSTIQYSNPTMDAVLSRRKLLSQSKHSLIWAAINGLFVFLLAIDLKWSVIGGLMDWWFFSKTVLISDVLLSLLLLINMGYDLYLFVWAKYWMTDIELTSAQMIAFGVKPNELGFKEKKPSEEKSKDAHNWTISSEGSPVFEMSSLSDLDRHTSLNSTQLSMANMSALSDGTLATPTSDFSLNSTATSWEYRRSTPLRSPTGDTNSSFVRNRRSFNKSANESFIANRNELDNYLKKFDTNEQRIEELVESEKRRQVNTSTTGWGSPLSDNVSAEDTNQIGYQMAIDSPLRSLNNTDLDSMTTSVTVSKAMDSLLTKLKITEPTLNQWVENIRKWLSQTIISRLVQQIDLINDELLKSGHFEALIGEASLQTIGQIAKLKKNQISNIDNVLPFLEVTSNQKYLVQRLRDLSKGGVIGKFIWNSGGSYGPKSWTEELVTDSAIVIHLFNTYMDLRLPSDPNSPDGKAFTNTYFKSMTGTAPKSSVYLVEAKQSPPHYKLYTEEDGLWELPIGRNNLFHVMIAFLDYIKRKQLGYLGRINLGASGINILWVVHRDSFL